VGAIELVVIVLVLSFVVFTSKILGYFFGINPWLIGIPISGVVLAALWKAKLYLAGNRFPDCKNDSCKSYKLILSPSKEIIRQCASCGQQYVQKRNSFFILTDEGKLLRYKRRKFFFSKWEDDCAEEHISQPTAK